MTSRLRVFSAPWSGTEVATETPPTAAGCAVTLRAGRPNVWRQGPPRGGIAPEMSPATSARGYAHSRRLGLRPPGSTAERLLTMGTVRHRRARTACLLTVTFLAAAGCGN